MLQIVMGWEDSHLHSLTDRNPNTPGRGTSEARSWAPVYVRAEDDDDWYLPEETVQLGKVLNEGSTPLFYEYDFGDGWTHRIDWIETVKKTSDDVHAQVIRGKRRCPLEDSGGIGGYEDLIATLADPLTVLGRRRTDVVDGLTAEETLDAAGIGYLAEAYGLQLDDGRWLAVRLTEVSPEAIKVTKVGWGAIDAPQLHFTLPFPMPARLRACEMSL